MKQSNNETTMVLNRRTPMHNSTLVILNGAQRSEEPPATKYKLAGDSSGFALRMTIVINLLLFFLLGRTNQGEAQDIHFSQFTQTPLLINPALTGFFNGTNRAFINYKNQWRNIGAPYKTYAISYDMPLFKKKWDKSYLGAGFFAFNDKAGDTQLGTTQLNISFSGVVSLNENHSASLGLQGGFSQRSIDASSMRWGNQFDDGVYSSSLVSGETNAYEPSMLGDFSAGLAWSYSKDNTNITSNDQFMANAGIALFHINQPKIAFPSGGGDEKLYTKQVAHGSIYWGFKGTNIALLPSFLFLKQGPTQELNIGTMVRYQLKESSKYTGNIKGVAVLVGGYYRAGDAFIPTFILEVANFALGISYDVNVSGLTKASNGKGGMEISLRFINPSPFREVKHSLYGPSFY